MANFVIKVRHSDRAGFDAVPVDGWAAGAVDSDRRTVKRFVVARADERRVREGDLWVVREGREIASKRGRKPAIVAVHLVEQTSAQAVQAERAAAQNAAAQERERKMREEAAEMARERDELAELVGRERAERVPGMMLRSALQSAHAGRFDGFAKAQGFDR